MDQLVEGLVSWLAALPPWLAFMLLMAFFVVPVLVAVHVVRQRVSHEDMSRHHDVAGFVFAAVGGLYGVLLAFTTVMAFEHHHETEAATWAEAGAHHGMLDLLALSDDPRAREAERAIGAYANLVVNDELATENYTGRSAPAQESFRAIWQVAPRVELPTASANDQLLREMGKADAARTERLRGAQGAMPTSLWAVLALGAAAILGFSLLFSIEAYRPHLLVMGGLAGIIALVMFVNVQLNYPFIGADAVGPEAFTSLVLRASQG